MKKLFQIPFKNILSIILVSVIAENAHSQSSISGSITDSLGEALPRVSVLLDSIGQNNARGIFTNNLGRFTFSDVRPGKYVLRLRLLSYRSVSDTITIYDRDVVKTYPLYSTPFSLEEAVVVADRIIDQNAVSEAHLTYTDLRHRQGLLEDPIRALATLPGVGHGGDLFSPSPIYIRGGSPDENLFLIDNARVYWPWYFGGQKSMFNSETIESVELSPSGFGARYGDALSSVLNVTTRDGSRSRWSGNASIGFYNSQATVEGPIGDKFSLLVSGRRTYLDLFLKESATFPVPSFWDVTYKASAFLSENNKISLSGLQSSEGINFLTADPTPGLPNKLETNGTNGFNSLQWQSVMTSDLYSKLSVTYAKYNSSTIVGRTVDLNIKGNSYGAREDITAFLAKQLKLSSGVEYAWTSLVFNGSLPFDAADIDPNDTTIRLRTIMADQDYWTGAFYSTLDWNILHNLGISAGLRLDDHGSTNKAVISPRIALHYQWDESTVLRAAYGRYTQFPSPEGLERNPDLLSNEANHFTLGISHVFSPTVSGWIEAYHKKYSNLVVFDTNNNFSNNGEGYAQGIECFLRKDLGLLRGWISYAYSISKRKDAPDHQEYYFDYDQRHIINTVVECNLKQLSLPSYAPSFISISLRTASGRPYTPTISAVQTPSGWLPVKGEKNSLRDPAYFNTNVRFEWSFTINHEGDFQTYFEIWNLFSNKNILGRTYQYGQQYPNNVSVQPYYTTPILPAGGFKYTF